MKYRILVYFLIFSLEGCSYLSHWDQLMTLKGFSDNRKEAEKYVRNQNESFDKLLYDIQNNRLKKGTSKRVIRSRYGDPVFCKANEDRIGVEDACLYRHPLEYFSIDTVYLYFDENNKLNSWKFEQASTE